MEFRPRPDLEIRFEEHDAPVHANLPLPQWIGSDGLAWMKVPLATGSARSASLRVSAASGGGTRREREEPERHAESGPQHAAQEKDGETRPESAHDHPLGPRFRSSPHSRANFGVERALATLWRFGSP